MDRRTFLGTTATALLIAACTDESSGVVDDELDLGVDEDDGERPEAGARDDSQPRASIVTRWAQDPFSRGSYSYLAAGSTLADRATLGATVDNRLYFAGEATSIDYAASVHGALLTGFEAADAIVAQFGADVSVIVIGAGAAGLAAAQRLVDEDVEVSVVEGRNRLGGRVHTDTTLGVPVELGAGWIHGDDGNPLTELAERFGLDRAVTDLENIEIYDADGEEIDTDALEEIQDALAEVVADGVADGIQPLGPLIDEAISDAGGGADRERLARYVIAAAVEHEEATDYNTLSTETFEAGEEFGGDEVVLPDGYIELLSPLAEGLDVVLDATVSSIEYGPDGVEVGFADGSYAESDVAVVTVPLGVLKAGSIEFDPPLPDEKRASIDRLGMGVLNRVVLQFDEVFWDEDADLIGYAADDPGHFIEWQNLVHVTGRPIISGFNAGTAAERIESLSDTDAVAAAVRVLDTIYGAE